MGLPYFPMYPTDFEADTSHLTLAEDGAYNRLLRLMWMTPGCSLPADDAWIKRRMRVDQATFDEVVKVVVDEFFTVENGRLSNAKLSQIFAQSNEAHAKRVAAGAKGGKAKSLKTNNSGPSNAVAKPKQPEPEPLREGTNVPSGDLGFPEFWELWPDKRNKDAARKAWRKMSIENRRIAFSAIRDGWFNRWQLSQPDANPIHASTFLNRKRWEDEFPAQTQLKAISGGQNGQRTANKSQQRMDAFIAGAAGAG